MRNWKDIYALPLNLESGIDWVFDAGGNFVFQFLASFKQPDQKKKIMYILNEKAESETKSIITHKDGYILADNTKIILIRGWGNLTGPGGHNLSEEEAANVQDTFAEYIVERLSNTKNNDL